MERISEKTLNWLGGIEAHRSARHLHVRRRHLRHRLNEVRFLCERRAPSEPTDDTNEETAWSSMSYTGRLLEKPQKLHLSEWILKGGRRWKKKTVELSHMGWPRFPTWPKKRGDTGRRGEDGKCAPLKGVPSERANGPHRRKKDRGQEQLTTRKPEGY